MKDEMKKGEEEEIKRRSLQDCSSLGTRETKDSRETHASRVGEINGVPVQRSVFSNFLHLFSLPFLHFVRLVQQGNQINVFQSHQFDCIRLDYISLCARLDGVSS